MSGYSIFQRSETSRKACYTQYLGDGTQRISTIKEAKVYGDTEVEKLECVGHVQKCREALSDFGQRKVLNQSLFITIEERVVLLHGNVHLHVSRVTFVELAKFQWEQLDNLPYSPNMSHCDFTEFGPLKNIWMKHFNSNNKLKDAAKD
ncbi:hypothetical protein TNCV_947451 [Trichonephila clavipes]|nr:hypothetical protein TNCV_947451 [Trichonephila clavipes]